MASVKLVKVDISTTKHAEMVRFYEALLGIELKPVEVGPHTMHAGRLPDGGLRIALAPAALTGVPAVAGNRAQLNFQVGDVEKTFEAALAAGGTELEPVTAQGGKKQASLRDPDGSSIVLVE